MHTVARWLAVAVFSWAGTSMARIAPPPLEALRTADVNSVAATVMAVQTDPPALSLRIDTQFFGRPRSTVKVLVDPLLLDYIETGARYLLVYGDLEPVQGKPGVFVQTEHGTLATFDGAEPAIFRDSPEMRMLQDPAHRSAEQRTDYKTEVLAGLEQTDPQLQNLWAGELVLRGEVVAALETEDFARISSFVDRIDGHPSARTRLLAAASEYAPQLGSDWFKRSAAKIIGSETVQTSNSFYNREQLVIAAFDTLAKHSVTVPMADLTRWLRSPRPGIAEMALLRVRAQDPEAEAGVIEAVLAEQFLPIATRSFLVEHLRRLRASQTGNS